MMLHDDVTTTCPRTETEVSIDLQHQIQNAERGEQDAFALHPPEDWHDCPECGERLFAHSVIHNEPDEVLAVEYSCKCLTLWTWEQAPHEMYYRGTSNLATLFEDDTQSP